MPEIHPDDARLCVAIGTIGDERRALLEHLSELRTAMVPPAVVRDVVRSGLHVETGLMLNARSPEAEHRCRKRVETLQEWLRATAGAEGVRDA